MIDVTSDRRHRTMGSRVALGLGSNLGDRLGFLTRAADRLRKVLYEMRLSSIYQTAPMLVTDQPDFLNAACTGRTSLEPLQLLDALREIERTLGRTFGGRRYGPRAIDLDILLYDDLILRSRKLTIPHSRLHERGFVLMPLNEIAADWWVPPVCGRDGAMVAELAAAVSSEGVTRTTLTFDDG